MKKYRFLILLLVVAQQSEANPLTKEAIQVLKKVEKRLHDMQAVSYHQAREIRYYENNYYHAMEADMYIQSLPQSPIGIRFQATEKEDRFVFDGFTCLQIDGKDRTIDSTSANMLQKLSSNSYLYHSLAMLRNLLPVVISNDSIQKTISDTTIGNKQWVSIRLEGQAMYFGIFGGIERHNVPDLRRPYYLLVDKTTYLPYQFIAKYNRNGDERDHVTVTYSQINSAPQPPATGSWTYAAYADKYSPYKPKTRKPMVRVGDKVADFRLPAYTTGTKDSLSLAQYKGQIILIDFWFKSCGPCIEAMPHYNELQGKFGADGFQLLTINIEEGEEDMKFFYNKYKPVYKMLYHGQQVFDTLGLVGCPSAVLLDEQGKVIYVGEGFNKQRIEAKIQQAIAAQRSAKP